MKEKNTNKRFKMSMILAYERMVGEKKNYFLIVINKK